MNSARTKDEELDHVVDRIVSGLFSVMATMGRYIYYSIVMTGLTSNRRYANYTLS